MVTTLLILLGSIALIIWIIVYKANASLRKQRAILQQRIATEAKQNQLEWSLIDIEPRRAFAWSADKEVFFFMDFSDIGQEQTHIIHKNEIEDCQLIEHGASSKISKAYPEKSVSKIEVKIILNDKAPVILGIYNELVDGVFEKMKLAEKARQIKTLLSSKVLATHKK